MCVVCTCILYNIFMYVYMYCVHILWVLDIGTCVCTSCVILWSVDIHDSIYPACMYQKYVCAHVLCFSMCADKRMPTCMQNTDCEAHGEGGRKWHTQLGLRTRNEFHPLLWFGLNCVESSVTKRLGKIRTAKSAIPSGQRRELRNSLPEHQSFGRLPRGDGETGFPPLPCSEPGGEAHFPAPSSSLIG